VMTFAPTPEIRGRILFMHQLARDETMDASLGVVSHPIPLWTLTVARR
jgi:hypothetical protein